MTTPAQPTETTYPFFVQRMPDPDRAKKIYDEIFAGLTTGKNAVSKELAQVIIEDNWPDVILAIGDGSGLES